MNQNYCISVDWLQVYTLSNAAHPIPTQGSIENDGYTFSFTMLDIQTAMFKHVVSVSQFGLDVAVIEYAPRTSRLRQNMVLIKLANRVLYSAQYIKMLYALMSALKVIYKGITRIDLCYDCVSFLDGRSPARFINNYVMKPDTEIGGYVRKGSDEFICHGRKSSGQASRINYISFGSPQSRVRAYIYDKTVELSEVKDKPWIRALWDANGLVYDEKNHVYRSEISIKSEGTDLLNMSTGELFRLSPVYIENQAQIEKLFHYYAERYLYFSVNGGQKYRKNFPQLKLFKDRPEITCKPYHVNKSADTGRMEKICYNKIKSLSEQYSDLAEHRRTSLQTTLEFLKELQSLKEWSYENERRESYLNELRGQMFYDAQFMQLVNSIEDVHSLEERMLAEAAYLRSIDSIDY